MMATSAGAAVKLLPIAMMFGLLAACGQQPAPAKSAAVVKTPKAEIDEVDALIAATKRHPSLVNGGKDAGPPIHVDPVPKPGSNHQHTAK